MSLWNQFKGFDKYGMPTIPTFDVDYDELEELRLIGFDRAKARNDNHFRRMVHFLTM